MRLVTINTRVNMSRSRPNADPIATAGPVLAAQAAFFNTTTVGDTLVVVVFHSRRGAVQTVRSAIAHLEYTAAGEFTSLVIIFHSITVCGAQLDDSKEPVCPSRSEYRIVEMRKEASLYEEAQ